MKNKATKKDTAPKRGRGRPSRGPTVQVVMRMSKELHDRVEKLHRNVLKTKSKTEAIERLVEEALERRT